MITPIWHTWGTRYPPKQVAKADIPNYTPVSQAKLDEAVGKLINGFNKDEITHLIGFEQRTSDPPEIRNRSGLINGCLVSLGENRDSLKNVYLHILAESSNQEGFNKTLEYLCLPLKS